MIKDKIAETNYLFRHNDQLQNLNVQHIFKKKINCVFSKQYNSVTEDKHNNGTYMYSKIG